MISVTVRRWHTYIGLLCAPSVVFFALTGAVQIFSLHEAHGSYRPPLLMEKLSAVHKDQVFQKPHEHAPPGEAAGEGAAAASGDGPPAQAAEHAAGSAPEQRPGTPEEDDDEPAAATLALKWFFLFVSIALTGSTLAGVWLGLAYGRPRGLRWGLLIAGVLIPLALLALAG